MAGNTFGKVFRVTTWGESHGPALGAVIDGCPPRLPLTAADIDTVLASEKTLIRREGVHLASGQKVVGYEIHHGRTRTSSTVCPTSSPVPWSTPTSTAMHS